MRYWAQKLTRTGVAKRRQYVENGNMVPKKGRKETAANSGTFPATIKTGTTTSGGARQYECEVKHRHDKDSAGRHGHGYLYGHDAECLNDYKNPVFQQF